MISSARDVNDHRLEEGHPWIGSISDMTCSSTYLQRFNVPHSETKGLIVLAAWICDSSMQMEKVRKIYDPKMVLV